MGVIHRIRIHWGYYMQYAPYPWQHAGYTWDGGISADQGAIRRSWRIDFSGYYGDVRETLVELDRPQWNWEPPTAQNRLGGILFELEGDARSRVRFATKSIEFEFTVGELIDRGVIRKHLGQPYSNVDVTVIQDGFDPLLDQAWELEAMTKADGRLRRLIDAVDLAAPVYRWFRADWAWAPPGRHVELAVDIPDRPESRPGSTDRFQRFLQVTFRCVAAAADAGESIEHVVQRGSAHRPGNAGDVASLPYRIFVSGEEVCRAEQSFRDQNVPLIEELSVEIPGQSLEPGSVTVTLQNRSATDYLLVGRVYLEELLRRALEVRSCPRWVQQGHEFEVVLDCSLNQNGVSVEVPAGLVLLTAMPATLPRGRHGIRFRADAALCDSVITFVTESCRREALVEQVIAVEQEPYPMRIGFEDSTHQPAVPGYREEIIRDFVETQLGDLYMLRVGHSDQRALELARFCRDNGLYFQTDATSPPERVSAIRREIGDYLMCHHWGESDGFLWGYAARPEYHRVSVPEGERTMRTAHDDFVAYFRRMANATRGADPLVQPWVLFSAVGIGCAYEAGMDAGLSQFNKSNNALLVADARGAARAYGKPFWGTYQAEGAHVSPEGDQHLRMWWLSLHLAYVAGASQVADEECLYREYHQRSYGRNDLVPRLRRQILRDFCRYVRTHPRKGAIRANQACLIGRYACDVVDGISRTDEHGDREPVVWRSFGGWGDEWKPSTPEYGLRYLDAFLPGVWLQTLQLPPERVRRWFCGTPLGEIELIPIDAPAEVLAAFPLLLLLGWNTMDEGQYAGLRSYVENGGKLFMSVPHATMNESRKFLTDDFDPLNLVREGDFADLFGVRVTARGDKLGRLRGQEDIADNPVKAVFQWRTINQHPAEGPLDPRPDLAAVELCGAEVLVRDADSGAPVLVRSRVGAGEAYLLCTYEYPGNSYLAPLMKPLVRALSRSVAAPVEMEDPSGDIYFTVRNDEKSGTSRLHLLNTDWTEAGNEKECRIRLGDSWISLAVREGRISEVVWFEDLVILVEGPDLHVESIEQRSDGFEVTIHGHGETALLSRFISRRWGDAWTVEGVGTAIGKRAAWDVVHVDFHGCSVGRIMLTKGTV